MGLSRLDVERFLVEFQILKGEIGKGIVAGIDGEVQFNKLGNFGASSNLFWDDANNRLGIGTGSPGFELEVNGSIKTDEIGVGINPSATYKYLQSGGIMRIQDAGRLEIDSNNDNALKIVNGATTFLRVDTGGGAGTGTYFPSGNVGIGTVSPGAQLHVQTSGTAIIGQIIKGTASQSADLLRITDSSDNVDFVVDSDGNVGIGTTGPALELDVVGGGRFYSNGNSVQLQLRAGGVTAQDANLKYLETGGTTKFTLGYDASADTINLKPGNNNAALPGITMLTSGNVGIGITTPQELLAIGDGGYIVMDKASTTGIKVDNATPTFGFADLLGEVFQRNTGATKPTRATWKGGTFGFQFETDDDEEFEFHIPHDYVKGTDLFLHIHWGHNSTLVTGGTITFDYELTYAKGHGQGVFGANAIGTINSGTITTSQYSHDLSEGQISISGASGTQIDTDDLEPDGVIKATIGVDANNLTVSGGSAPDPFLHYVDIHYQTTGIIGTKDKAPDFYA